MQYFDFNIIITCNFVPKDKILIHIEKSKKGRYVSILKTQQFFKIFSAGNEAPHRLTEQSKTTLTKLKFQLTV